MVVFQADVKDVGWLLMVCVVGVRVVKQQREDTVFHDVF